MTTCHREDCDRFAQWRPIFVMRPWPGAPVMRGFPNGLEVCEDHADLALDDLVTVEGWERLQQQFAGQGLAPPELYCSSVYWTRTIGQA